MKITPMIFKFYRDDIEICLTVPIIVKPADNGMWNVSLNATPEFMADFKQYLLNNEFLAGEFSFKND